jgi:hypothetical protein
MKIFVLITILYNAAQSGSSCVMLYRNATMASKKMIIPQIFKSVRVKRDYELEIDFNIAYDQYCMGF